jgi:uncharacterized protein YbjT (DUF2867 family)
MNETVAPLVRRALVAGGTGLVGSELVRRLGQDARYARVTTLGRRVVENAGKIENLVVSFDDLEQHELPAVDDAFCCLGTTRRTAGSDEAFRHVDLDYVLAYARAAKRAGAVRFLLVSSIGANAQSTLLYTRVKGEAEAGVQAIGFPMIGIVRPSFLVGKRTEKRSGEALALALGGLAGPLMLGPFRRYRPIDAGVVARALVCLATTAADGVTILSGPDIIAPGSPST